MDVGRIVEILIDCLGEVDDKGRPRPDSEVVDAWELVSLKPAKVKAHKREMIELLREWPHECWGHSVPPLGHPINYIITGAILGDQRHAFLLFAFGKLLRWWEILDPRTEYGLSRDDPRAEQWAEEGMIVMRGYRLGITAIS